MNMAVELCGINLKNPIIAASGTFGFGADFAQFYDISRLGGISIKGLTLTPREGNPAPRIAETAAGMLNAVGLQNPGVDAFLRDEMPRLRQQDICVIANIAGNTIDDYVRMAEKLQGSGVHLVELNISCPNVEQGGMHFGVLPEAVRKVTAEVKSVCSQPLMVKLSPNVADIVKNALAAQEGGADAVSLINTITGMAVDAEKRQPMLANITGGLSGPAIKPVALRMVYQVAQAVDIPVCGMGGIMSGRDVVEFLLCGARCVMVGTANVADPMALVRILGELEEFMQEQGVPDVREFIGALKT